MESLHSAYQGALESAIVSVSESRLANSSEQTLAHRIETGLRELDKLQGVQIPDYTSPDVALLYSHWYLPEQVNLAYTLSASLLPERLEHRHLGRPLQLVDFGAGSGAMVLGLILAVASYPRHQWPEMIAVYQIDLPAMLDLGDDIWCSLAVEASKTEGLADVSALMARTLFERTEATQEETCIEGWAGAERWLAALHVVYEETIGDTKVAFQGLLETVRPHFRVVTVPKSKEARIKNPKSVGLLLQGTAPTILAHRYRIATELNDDF